MLLSVLCPLPRSLWWSSEKLVGGKLGAGVAPPRPLDAPGVGLNLPVARSQGNRPLAPTPVDPTRPVHHAAEVDPVLLRGPGPFPRRPDDRRAPASARDVVAVNMPASCGMSRNLRPAL